MPLQQCSKDGSPGYQWGDAGACYTYDAGDQDSANEAKRKAHVQGYAMGDLSKEEAEVAGVDTELEKAHSREYLEATVEKIRTLYPHVWTAIHQYALPRSGGRALANRRRAADQEKDQPGASDVHVPAAGGSRQESINSYRRRRGLKADAINEEQAEAIDAWAGYVELVAKMGAHPGSMVAAFPPHDVAAKLAMPGGETAGKLHMTLAALPDSADLTDEHLGNAVRAIKDYAAGCAPMNASISGVGRFHGLSKAAGGQHVIYASVDHPDLPAFRHGLVSALKDAGVPVKEEHGFTPHMTLAYVSPETPMPQHPAGSQRFDFPIDSITMSAGGEAHTFPLGGRIGKAEWKEIADLLFAKAEGDAPATATAKQIVYGVVLQPGIKDSQNDVITADDIQKAAHRYLVASRIVGVQHEQQAKAEVVESFIAPTDMEFQAPDGTVRKVVKGSWVMAVHVSDEGLWKAVLKGEITGFSIGGTGVREALRPAA